MSQTPLSGDTAGDTNWETILKSLREPLGPKESILPRVMAKLDQQVIQPALTPEPASPRRLSSRSRFYFLRVRQIQAAMGFSLLGMALITLAWMGVFTGQGLTMAEVAQAVAKQRWAHLVYDDQMEVWVCLDDGRYLWKRKGGACFHRDPVNRTEESYDPDLGQITVRKPEAWVLGVTRNGKTIPLQVDALQFPDVDRKAPEKKIIKAENIPFFSVEYSIEHKQGQSLGRFDEYRGDAFGEIHLVRSMWVDLKTKLPVRVRERMNARDRGIEGREYREGTYSFIESGPMDLAQLGVPKGTPIQIEVAPTRFSSAAQPQSDKTGPPAPAESKDQTAPAGVQESAALTQLPPDTRRALQGAAQAIAKFPRNLRIFELEGGTRQLSYWSASPQYMKSLAKQVLLEGGNAEAMPNPYRFFSVDNQESSGVPEYLWEFTRDSDLPMDQIMKWFPIDRGANTHLVDGAKTYRLTARSLNRRELHLHVLGAIVSHTPPPFADQWEFATWNTTELSAGKTEDSSAGKLGAAVPPGLIVVRSERANLKKEWHVDPQKDFAAVRCLEWRKEKGTWLQTSDRRAVGWKQLPGGAWYVSAWEITHKMMIAKKDPQGNPVATEETSTFGRRVEITVLQEADFPQAIFDGKKFVEKAVKAGAKAESD